MSRVPFCLSASFLHSRSALFARAVAELFLHVFAVGAALHGSRFRPADGAAARGILGTC
ncbi:hypothetical protein [Microbacterium sp. AK031]|uniref:hypothetical protein n=1 Tax=Microbacterium sp. AK031 TaxID=2723076 RepID=UPI00216848ED|nr:hypothetical protein [Microbacterium sp. AK031]MCS3844345.1 hypothetical protein [Microbacterium sp. AK031]